MLPAGSWGAHSRGYAETRSVSSPPALSVFCCDLFLTSQRHDSGALGPLNPQLIIGSATSAAASQPLTFLFPVPIAPPLPNPPNFKINFSCVRFLGLAGAMCSVLESPGKNPCLQLVPSHLPLAPTLGWIVSQLQRDDSTPCPVANSPSSATARGFITARLSCKWNPLDRADQRVFHRCELIVHL